MHATHPLHWPVGRPRTERRRASSFGTSGPDALAHLADQVRLLGGRSLEISTNLPVQRHRSEPRWSDKAPADPGVAVFLVLDGEEICFACDRWLTVADNLRAIGKTMEALRGIARWGSEEMMRQAFSGYAALPAGELPPQPPSPASGPPPDPPEEPWWIVLGVRQDISRPELDRHYRRWARVHHPDVGGDAARFRAITTAYRHATTATTREVRS